VEVEADEDLPVLGLPLNEPAAVRFQPGDVGEVEGLDIVGGEVPPDAPSAETWSSLVRRWSKL